MNNSKTCLILEIAVLLLVAVELVVRDLLIPIAAALITIASPRHKAVPEAAAEPLVVTEPTPVDAAPEPAAEPLHHPLLSIATELQALTTRELQALANSRRKASKARLAAMVIALPI